MHSSKKHNMANFVVGTIVLDIHDDFNDRVPSFRIFQKLADQKQTRRSIVYTDRIEQVNVE